MPKEADIKPSQMMESITRNSAVSVRSTREEPIAFGLVALIADFVTDDKSGAMEEIESTLRSSETVGEFEVIGASRISADVKTN